MPRPSRPTVIGPVTGAITGPVVIANLAIITMLSQFHRSAPSPIGPELMQALGMSPGELGLANGAFFIPFVLLMIPLGALFDRYGPRRVVTVLTMVAVVAAGLQGAARTPAEFVAARALLGLGQAGSFMSAVLLTSRWYAGERFTTVLSWVFAASNVGSVLAGSPFAALAEGIGWRAAFAVTGGATLVAGTLFWAFVRDAPDGHDMAAPRPESLRETVAGLVEVWRSPGLGRILAMHVVAYASMLTMLSLWAGPYLNDVHGLDGVARGNVIAAMAAAQICGLMLYGPLDRLINSRKRVVLGGGVLTVAVMGTLALWPTPPLAAAVGLLVLDCLVTAYPIVIVAHGRSLFPEHLAGRGITTVNLGQTTGTVLLPILTGWVVSAFPATAAGGAPEVAYRAAFALIALAVALGLAVYAGVRDAPPRPLPASG